MTGAVLGHGGWAFGGLRLHGRRKLISKQSVNVQYNDRRGVNTVKTKKAGGAEVRGWSWERV